MTQVYEITSIKRNSGNTDADNGRIGLRVTPHRLSLFVGAILVLVDDPSKALHTSKVLDITREENGDLIVTTRNTNYVMKKEAI